MALSFGKAKDVIIITVNEHNWKRRFYILWAGQTISIFTSSVIQMGIIWYLTEQTGSASILSLATLIGFLPQAVLGPFIGVLIDRYNRKTIMILSDIFIAAVTLILVIVGVYSALPVWLIMAVLFARSIGTAFHEPSLQAVTPLIVPQDYLAKCAGYTQTFESLSLLLSPAAAALLYGIWNINIIFLLDIVGAAIAVFTIGITAIPHLINTEETRVPNVIREAKEAITVLHQEKGMIALLVIGALYALIYMPIGTLYPLISMSYFKGTFVESGIIEVAFALGSLIGSIALGVWGNKIDKTATIAKSIGIMGIGLIITGLLPSSGFKIFAALAAIMGASTPFYWGVQTAIFQLKIKPEYLGRVLSLSFSLGLISMPLGLSLSGAFAEVIGVEKWFLISGIAAVILALFCACLPSLHNCCKDERI